MARLFVAAEIDPSLARELGRVSGEMRQQVEARAPRAQVTWVPPERLHFTVHFIGEVAADRAEAIKAALAQPLGVPAFDLTVAGLGTFPTRGTPRVVWVGVGDGREALIALEREVTGRLGNFRLKAEATGTAQAAGTAKARYTPHLTLARVRDAAGLRPRDLLRLAPQGPFGTTHVGAITLFESRLSPKGPQYLALQSTDLRSAI